MKDYTIYLTAIPDCQDKAPKAEIDAARLKAIEESKKIFKESIKDNIEAEEIELRKEQSINEAIMISVNEKAIDKVIKKFIDMSVVLTIDAEYSGPPLKDEPKVKEKSSKEKMEKYIK